LVEVYILLGPSSLYQKIRELPTWYSHHIMWIEGLAGKLETGTKIVGTGVRKRWYSTFESKRLHSLPQSIWVSTAAAINFRNAWTVDTSHG